MIFLIFPYITLEFVEYIFTGTMLFFMWNIKMIVHMLCSFVHPNACIWKAGTIRITAGRKEMNTQCMRLYFIDLFCC